MSTQEPDAPAPATRDARQDAVELVQSAGLQHAQARRIRYVRADGAAGAGEAAVARLPDLDNVLAFLKGDAAADVHRSAEDIRQLASDAEKLAELILRAVEIRAAAADTGEGALLAVVVGCIRKVAGELSQSPAARTQKGRRHLTRSLLLLKKTLLDRLRGLAGDAAAQAAETCLGQAVAALDAEALSAKYAKSQREAAASGSQLRQLISRMEGDPTQVDALRARLLEQGIGEDGWQALAVRTGQPNVPAGFGQGSGVDEIKRLTALLARLTEAVRDSQAAARPAAPSVAAVQALVNEASRQMTALTPTTKRKIGILQQWLQATTPDPGILPALSRKELLEVLAEIAQELAQPLTVVRAALALLREQEAGATNALHAELLGMVEESSTRMSHLVECLMRIAGMPATLWPNQDILGTVYRA